MQLYRLLHPVARSLHRYYSMDLKEVVDRLDRFAPPSLAESWDNVGLLLQPYTKRDVKTVMLTNDLTEEVMKEAVENNADLILSYHPPLFHPFKRITGGWKDRIVACCLEKGIAIYSPHTAYDMLKGGVNDWLIKAFCVSEVVPLQQKDASPPYSHEVQIIPSDRDVQSLVERITQELDQKACEIRESQTSVSILCGKEELPSVVNLASSSPDPPQMDVRKLEKVPLVDHGAGRKANLTEVTTVQEAINKIKAYLELPYLRVALANGSSLESQIKTVAVCAGSGASVLRGVRADLWLTGEMSHHEVLDAVHKGTTVVLVEHSNSERGFLAQLRHRLNALFNWKVNVIISQKDRDSLQIM